MLSIKDMRTTLLLFLDTDVQKSNKIIDIAVLSCYNKYVYAVEYAA